MILLNLFSKTIAITAKVAPDKFANPSITSAVLESVKNCCINSITIPKKKENKKEKNKGLKTLGAFNSFLKNKNQSIVKTK